MNLLLITMGKVIIMIMDQPKITINKIYYKAVKILKYQFKLIIIGTQTTGIYIGQMVGCALIFLGV